MVDNDGRQNGLQEAPTGAQDRSQQAESATARLKATGGEQARKVASAARERVEEQANTLKDEGVDGLRAFSQAVRRAGDELGRSQQPGPVAELVRQAAAGLEDVSESLAGQSTGDMIETLRTFGRRNPAAFVAGSVLAGFALGRFASMPAPARKDRPRTGMSEPASDVGRTAPSQPEPHPAQNTMAQPSAGTLGTF